MGRWNLNDAAGVILGQRLNGVGPFAALNAEESPGESGHVRLLWWHR